MRLHLLCLTVLALVACDDAYDDPVGPPLAQPTAVIAASGNLANGMNELRTALGDANGGVAGQQPAGRREINWDGAAANPFNNRNDFPADFFNTTVKAGAVFSTPGSGFRNDSLRFTEVDASYDAEFSFFSATRVFAPVGSNVMDVRFRVAGEQTPATVRGFGVVFSDVDQASTTRIELYDRDDRRLAVVHAPVRSDVSGLSLAAALFAEPVVARVRIVVGTGAMGAGVKDVSAGGNRDLVVLDNFVYGEPTALPVR